MNELDIVKCIAELVKQGIDNNPNFSEWEKWWRKCGVEETVEVAKQYYQQLILHQQQQNLRQELNNTREEK